MKIFDRLKKLSSIALLLCVATQVQAADIDLATAQSKARSFMTKQVANGRLKAAATANLKLVKAEASVAKPEAVDYYIFNTDKAYVVIAGDDLAPEILMYGEEGNVNLDNIPPAMQWLLNKYKYQIDGLKAGTLKPNGYTPKATTAVAPLTNANWDQGAPYYNHTPTSGSTHAYTGCPATSLSMCFYIYKWPKTYPALSKVSVSGGLTAAALEEKAADWDNMLDEYTGPTNYSYTTTQAEAVSWLMRYVGQACNMQYTTSGSGAYDDEIHQACLTMGYTDAQLLTLTTGYAGSNQNYTDSQWNEWMLAELHAGRPIEYLASDPSAGGHAFNVFGCDTSGKYYVNWGWSGEDNGYCTLHNFTTGNNSTGQGGGSYTFNYGEAMIIGIAPPAGALGPQISVDQSTLSFEGYVGETYTKTFTVTGTNLEGDITVSKQGSSIFTVSPTTITAANAANGVQVTITYKPTTTGTTNAYLTLSSTGAESKTVNVSGTASYEIIDPVATAATDVTATSFTANWTACANASSYTLRVMPKPEVTTTLLLTETFAKCTSNTSTQNLSSTINNYTDNSGWSCNNRVYQDIGGVRLGSGQGTGTLTSPALDLSNSNGKVSVVFEAKTYNNDTDCNFKVSCGNASETTVIPNSTVAEYTVVLDCTAAASQNVTFATTAKSKRVILTNVEIYAGDITAGAAKADGEMLFPGITDTHYTVTGLEPATTYIYDVKAVYGTQESNWSNQIEVTTLEEETGITLAELLSTGVNGEEYTISNDLAVADYADYANNAFLTDGEGNWIMVTAADNDVFGQIYNNSTLKGKTVKGVLSGMGLNPVLTITEAPEAAETTVSYEIAKYYLSETFAPQINEVIDVVGYWNASDGALRAYSPEGGVQGQSLTLDTSWGAASNTLQNGKRYIVRCGINIKEPWTLRSGITFKDYDYDFQNYLGYALRLPDSPTAIGTIDIDGGNDLVNVYNAQGQLLRSNVKAADATRNLPRGIYIVGNKKVVVK